MARQRPFGRARRFLERAGSLSRRGWDDAIARSLAPEARLAAVFEARGARGARGAGLAAHAALARREQLAPREFEVLYARFVRRA